VKTKNIGHSTIKELLCAQSKLNRNRKERKMERKEKEGEKRRMKGKEEKSIRKR
jgi:hypothetical protein